MAEIIECFFDDETNSLKFATERQYRLLEMPNPFDGTVEVGAPFNYEYAERIISEQLSLISSLKNMYLEYNNMIKFELRFTQLEDLVIYSNIYDTDTSYLKNIKFESVIDVERFINDFNKNYVVMKNFLEEFKNKLLVLGRGYDYDYISKPFLWKAPGLISTETWTYNFDNHDRSYRFYTNPGKLPYPKNIFGEEFIIYPFEGNYINLTMHAVFRGSESRDWSRKEQTKTFSFINKIKSSNYGEYKESLSSNIAETGVGDWVGDGIQILEAHRRVYYCAELFIGNDASLKQSKIKLGIGITEPIYTEEKIDVDGNGTIDWIKQTSSYPPYSNPVSSGETDRYLEDLDVTIEIKTIDKRLKEAFFWCSLNLNSSNFNSDKYISEGVIKPIFVEYDKFGNEFGWCAITTVPIKTSASLTKVNWVRNSVKLINGESRDITYITKKKEAFGIFKNVKNVMYFGDVLENLK